MEEGVKDADCEARVSARALKKKSGAFRAL